MAAQPAPRKLDMSAEGLLLADESGCHVRFAKVSSPEISQRGSDRTSKSVSTYSSMHVWKPKATRISIFILAPPLFIPQHNVSDALRYTDEKGASLIEDVD
jgi:hypothetical protein